MLPRDPRKADNACMHPDCPSMCDLRKYDKPPPGWATIVLTRWGRTKNTLHSAMLCPKHTVTYSAKQLTLI